MPDELVDVLYMLLMGFGSKKSLEEPPLIMNLLYVANFLQGSNCILHDGCLLCGRPCCRYFSQVLDKELAHKF